MRGNLKLSRPTRDRSIVAAWLMGFAAIRAGSPGERDQYWQVRAGLENLGGVPLARPDSWSWAPVDGNFYPNSPGWNVVLALAWQLGEHWGLFLISFALLWGLLGLAYFVARRLGARPLPALAALTACIFIAFPSLSPRATAAAQLLLLAALVAPALWRPYAMQLSPIVNFIVASTTAAILSTLGNWTHLSWLTLSPLVAASWATYWLFLRLTSPGAPHRARLAALLVGGTIGLATGPLASPYGLKVGVERTLETQRITAGLITEWVSPFTAGLSLQWPMFALFVGVMALATLRWLFNEATDCSAPEPVALAACIATVAIPFAFAGLFSIRFIGLAVLTLGPLIAFGATNIADTTATAARRNPDTNALRHWARILTEGDEWRRVLPAVFIVLLPAVLWLGPINHARTEESRAITVLPQGCRFFGTAGVSNVVILERPDVRVWIDGRADYYGRGRLGQATGYFAGAQPSAAPEGTTCVILPSPESRYSLPPATSRINAEPGWDYRGRINGFDVWVR